MTREQYTHRLETLRSEVHAMGQLAVERFEDSLEVLRTGDRGLAREVIEGDHELNDRYLELEGECVELVALHQPVAGDLRLIASSFKVLTDLERVGDLAANLAEYGSERGGLASERRPTSAGSSDERSESERVDVEGIGSDAAAMLRDALAAYATDDAAACHEVAARDDQLDEDCRAAASDVVRSLVAADASAMTGAEIEARLEAVSNALLTIRDVERVGDHAVNVAARTLYQVEADDSLLY